MAARTIRITEPLDLVRIMRPLMRGTGDPTMRMRGAEVLRTMRNPRRSGDGEVRDGRLIGDPGGRVRAGRGPRAGARARDDRLEDRTEGFEPRHRVVADLWRLHRGVRLTRTGSILPVLIAAILEQKVTGVEASRAWRRLVMTVGELAPPPNTLHDGLPLLLPPDPARVAALPYFAFHGFGVVRRRAEVIRAVCERATRIESLATLPSHEFAPGSSLFPA